MVGRALLAGYHPNVFRCVKQTQTAYKVKREIAKWIETKRQLNTENISDRHLSVHKLTLIRDALKIITWKWSNFKFKFKCFIYPTEVHDIIYNLYVVRFWREGRQRSIAYRAVHLNTKTLIHEYCKLSIYHSRILNDIENSTKRKKAKVH